MAGKKGAMTQEHKAALAEGRAQGRAIREYLEGLDATKPKRGRKRTPEGMQKRLEAIESELLNARSIRRVELIQERMNLDTELNSQGESIDIDTLEASFVEAALEYSQRKGITYAAWREAGVPAAVLKRADIARSA